MTVLQESKNGKKNRMEIYYGFLRNPAKEVNQYELVIDKLRRKGLNVEIFLKIKDLLRDNTQISSFLPDYITKSLDSHKND